MRLKFPHKTFTTPNSKREIVTVRVITRIKSDLSFLPILGSVLGPLLFHIFLNDILYFENRGFLSNYSDDNVLYDISSNLEEVNQDPLKLSEWFYENWIILNPEKCHHLSLVKDSEGDLLRFCGEVLEASQIETVLGIQIDNR